MKIVIIQNTNREFWPAFKVRKEHLKAIKKAFPKTDVTVVDDVKLKQIASSPAPEAVRDPRNDIYGAEVIITTPFFLNDLEKVILNSIQDPYNNGSRIKSGMTQSVKWIHTTSAGVDRLPQAFKDSDVIVTNSSGVHPIPISEHVFSFVLMFARGLHISLRNQIEKGEWERNFQKFNVAELPDQTIGVVGVGRIGEEVISLAKLFGMKVLSVTSKTGNLDELLKNSNYVVNCLPLTPATLHFFDKRKLSKMKKSAFFINIGRGKTVDERALIEALEGRKIAGAGLDVTEEEPLPKSSPLWKLKNVILTPHYSGWTPHYMDRVIEIFCKNFKAYLGKRRMPNLVDKERGY